MLTSYLCYHALLKVCSVRSVLLIRQSLFLFFSKSAFEGEDARGNWRSSPGRRPSPGRTSRSPSGSRSRSADASPRHGR